MPEDKSNYELLAKGYLDLWQDQVNALAADPAMAQGVAEGIRALSGGLAAMMSPANVQKPGESDASATSGATPASSSSVDAGGDVAVLVGRIAELEKRVAELEKRDGKKTARRPAASSGRRSEKSKPASLE